MDSQAATVYQGRHPKVPKLHSSDDQGRVENWKSLYEELKPILGRIPKSCFSPGQNSRLDYR
ncbi:hypothetical protein X474_07220 [Dethiosulfatarculus sandiegensis]|uniref:Uncharacterized protein n=1 Tax=Dethiosulfatarculus sandiegensis TaxID=1429043 RepID=A0A0D2JGR0_9BACT|nr:hypothetical protein X474_07220 [Dethiosulfatarculus sandiegensis]